MTSTAGITETQVFEIADRLIVAGQRPTLKSIRDELKTGSFTTIGIHLQKWKKLKLEQIPSPQPPSEFQTIVTRMWEIAYREADKLLTTERRFFESQQTQWSEEKQDFLAVIRELEAKNETELSNGQGLQLKLEVLTEQLTATTGKLTQVSTQYGETEARRLETLERADRLEDRLAELLQRTGPTRSSIAEEKYLDGNKKGVETMSGSR